MKVPEDIDLDIEKINNTLNNITEVKAGVDVWQNAFHEFDVYAHTADFVKNLSGLTLDRNMIAAGWLHDIGKPVTAELKIGKDGKPQEREPGKPYHEFEDHEVVGEDMVRKMDSQLFLGLGLDQEKVAKLVGCHYIPMKGIKNLRKTINLEEFTKSFNELDSNLSNLEVSKEEVLTMFLADKLAQGKFCTDKEELLLIREVLLKQDKNEVDLRKIYEMQKVAYGGKE